MLGQGPFGRGGSAGPRPAGRTRIHAMLGGSDCCIATQPSDMAVATQALDAVLHVEGEGGARDVPVDALYWLPGDTPGRETTLAPGELITEVSLPPPPARPMHYRKARDRASYAFALVSVAAVLDVADDRTVRGVRLTLGGVATHPWRARRTEAELADAVAHSESAFKIPLARRAVIHTLRRLAAGAA